MEICTYNDTKLDEIIYNISRDIIYYEIYLNKGIKIADNAQDYELAFKLISLKYHIRIGANNIFESFRKNRNDSRIIEIIKISYVDSISLLRNQVKDEIENIKLNNKQFKKEWDKAYRRRYFEEVYVYLN